MHITPIVVVEADNADHALAEADGFIDTLIENSDGYFDGARVIKGQKPARAGTPQYQALVDEMLSAEADTVQEYWDKIRTAIPPLADRATIPDDNDRVHVRFRYGTGIDGVVKAGEGVDTDMPFDLFVYDMYKLYLLKNHMEDRSGTHPGSDARVYDARHNTDVAVREATPGTYAVWLDLHY